MSRVLVIKANPKTDETSNTFQLSNIFVEEYKRNHPEDEIIELDLYKENIVPLNGQMVGEIFGGVENEVRRHAELFASADKYVFAAPMWNLSIPAILKCYIDYVSYVGIAFKYTEHGAVGLLNDRPRKALHVVTRGGMYSEGPAASFEHGDSYLRTILGFFGITDVQTLSLELTNVLQGEALEGARNVANERAVEIAKTF